MEARRPTIKDVAREAGVDISTVSRVVNGTGSISSDTRRRVEAIVRKLDYRPNSAARAMVTNRTRTFAFLVPSLADPNVAPFAAGAEERARAAGYSMVVAGYGVDGEPDHFFREHRADGLLLMSPRHFAAAQPRLPVATLDEAPVDNVEGGRIVGRHLHAHGHRSVAFVGGYDSSSHARQRLEGLRGVLQGVHVAFGDWTPECGFTLARDILASRPDVTAVFAASDSVALGVLNALHSSGRSIPEDVSVVGFDDITMAKHFFPALTTVSQPLREVGGRAFDLLLARIEGRPADPTPPLPVQLIERCSSGPPRGG